MTESLTLGFSPCPNDTFMFHGLVSGAVEVPGIRFDVVLDDIEGLNARALGPAGDRLDLTKISASSLGVACSHYRALRSGAALGRGCGPLVVTRKDASFTRLADLAGSTVAIPGQRTTANLLLKVFGPAQVRPRVMRFDRIMPALAAGEVDAGVIIHESRFTYPQFGLRELADLGRSWESDTGLPLSLGLIAARRDLNPSVIHDIEQALARSIRLAREQPELSRDYVRAHAQEMDVDVCRRHIELYVNDFSVALGDEGIRAVDMLLQRAREVGLAPVHAPSPWG